MSIEKFLIPDSKVSFLLSLYNEECPNFLNQCLNSILYQTYSNFEVVIVLDGPVSQELLNIVNEFKNKMDVNIVQLQFNSGLAKALNYGLSFCKSEFIARIDTDDICYPDRLKMQVSFLLSHPDIVVLGSGATVINFDGSITSEKQNPCYNSEIISSLWCNPIIHPSVMFRKSEILKLGGYNEKLRRRQDYELWFRLANANLKFHNLPESLIYYRFDSHTLNKQSFKLNFEQGIIGFKGSLKLNLPLHKAFLCFYPCIRVIFPVFLQKRINLIFRKFDPRNNIK